MSSRTWSRPATAGTGARSWPAPTCGSRNCGCCLRLCHALGYFPHARSAVESLVMTLQDLTPREPQAQLFFRIVDEQADNMRALIGDLLDTARIEAGALSVAAEAADVAALAERTV